MTFDPVLIGEHIKQLLKTHNMTQDQLANHLHITKSAVSQNLNGKSSFDIQNLIAISKLFSISLDALLGLKSDEKRLPSAYELLLEKGLEY
jgi:transcriptional regulator with XRE-family HTH domain